MISYQAISDEALIPLLQKGDVQAFSEIYDRYKGLLYLHAFRRLNDSSEAEDLIHDLFASLWTNRAKLTIAEKLSSYLYVATRNRIIKLVAREKLKTNYLESINDFFDRGDLATDHQVRTRDLEKLIEKEISALPEKMRKIFLMSRFENLSHKQIAEKLDLSEQTVSKQVSNALKILRSKLGMTVFIIMLSKF